MLRPPDSIKARRHRHLLPVAPWYKAPAEEFAAHLPVLHLLLRYTQALIAQVPVMPGAFNQVILNILVNAAHAIGEVVADAPLVKGKITLSTRKIGDIVEIRIQDTGGGIPENIRDRIFDPFFTTKIVGIGTGQGLAIAHDVIVKKHRGSISVESQDGIGTTFIVRLPLKLEETAVAA